MATAVLSPADVNVAKPLSLAPAWWLRAHSYSLPLVVGANIGLTWLFVRFAEQSPWSSPFWDELLTAGMLGFVFAQCFLLGMWAALGGLATVPRWLVVGTVYVLGALAMAAAAFGQGNWESFIDSAPEVLLLGGALMSAFAALLLPLRRLAGWRVDFDAAYHQPESRRRGQLALMDFAAMFCAVALPLTLCRVLMESELGQSSPPEAAELLLFLGVFGVIVALTAAPVAYAALARRYGRWLAAAAAWAVAMSWGQSLLAAVVPDLNLFGSRPPIFGLHWEMLALHFGIASAVALPLLVLRGCGLRLLVIESR